MCCRCKVAFLLIRSVVVFHRSPALPSQLSSTRVYIHLFQLRLLPWTMFHSLQCTMVNPFVAGSLILFTFIEIMETLNFQESFQVQWLLKFLSMTELKISFLKSHSKKLEASSFNSINEWGVYRLIKLRFCMGQNAGYFNKANQRYSFFYSVLKKLPQK